MPRIEVTPEEQILILQRRLAEAQNEGIKLGLRHAAEVVERLVKLEPKSLDEWLERTKHMQGYFERANVLEVYRK